MKKFKQIGKEKIVFEGKTFQIIKQRFSVGSKTIEVEKAMRSPGVRLIIINENKILLTKEYRPELKRYDYRLPGGKVFDNLKEYQNSLNKKDNILKKSIEAAKKECIEETGLIAKNVRHYQTSHAGLTVIWDLYYFIVDDSKKHEKGQQLEHDEVIYPEWKKFEEVKKLCLNGKIREDRTVGILLKFLLNSDK